MKLKKTTSEDKISMLEAKVELLQKRVDQLSKNISQTPSRLEFDSMVREHQSSGSLFDVFF